MPLAFKLTVPVPQRVTLLAEETVGELTTIYALLVIESGVAAHNDVAFSFTL